MYFFFIVKRQYLIIIARTNFNGPLAMSRSSSREGLWLSTAYWVTKSRILISCSCCNNHHDVGGLKQQKCTLSLFWRPEGWQGCCTPSSRPRGEAILRLFRLLAAVSIPSFVATPSIQALPLWSHCLHVCLSNPPLPHS